MVNLQWLIALDHNVPESPEYGRAAFNFLTLMQPFFHTPQKFILFSENVASMLPVGLLVASLHYNIWTVDYSKCG
jgi:hypothetical protein